MINRIILLMVVLITLGVDAEFFSQNGQDEFVAQWFNNKHGGIFVDIGASDGITINNSYYFEKELGWQGICVEPRPSSFAKLVKNRRCFCVNACIAQEEGSRDFCEIEGYAGDLSGLISSYHPSHVDRIESEIKKFGGYKKIYKVECLPLAKLFGKYRIAAIDFLTIDTEGSEFEVLSSIDYAKVTIDIICVENLYNDSRIKNLLEQHKFAFIKHHDGDDFYVSQVAHRF